MCTLPPILAPKHRSKNRRQPKHGLGLIRKNGCANVHSTRRVISPDVYFFARRFCSTSSIRLPEIRGRKSDVRFYHSVIKNECDFFIISPSIRPTVPHLVAKAWCPSA